MELRTVLEYPKFSLTQEERDSIIENEILPYFEIVEVVKEVKGYAEILKMISLFRVPFQHLQIIL